MFKNIKFILLFYVFSAVFVENLYAESISGRAYKLNKYLHLVVLPIGDNERVVDKAVLKRNFPKPEGLNFLLGDIYFYVPGKDGLKDEGNLKKGLRFDENVVQIVSIQPWTEEMYKSLPIAGRDARIGWGNYKWDEKQNKATDFLGMKCHSQMRGRMCLVERSPGEWAIFDIDASGEGAFPYPKISTRYFSSKYGGVTVMWSTSVKNAMQWREIDAKLWALIDSWNIAD